MENKPLITRLVTINQCLSTGKGVPQHKLDANAMTAHYVALKRKHYFSPIL